MTSVDSTGVSAKSHLWLAIVASASVASLVVRVESDEWCFFPSVFVESRLKIF